jgi:predicted porin
MKRLLLLLVLVSAGLLLGTPRVFAQNEEEMQGDTTPAPPPAPAGLTMQMSNGWNFTFAGNVNAFAVYTDARVDDTDPNAIIGSAVPAEEKVFRIRTGLLPAFSVFEAKGHEKSVDLGVHFGFAPQIQSPGVHDAFGAQIDMRQVYAFVGGTWGQILFGREIGLYQRQNILTDMTLFGTGASGGGVGAGGTTLGRIGFGYIYPNFNAQLTYSSPSTSPVQLSIGAFDPSFIFGDSASYTITKTPRFETEITYKGDFGESNKVLLWAGGMWQKAELLLDDSGEGPNDVNGLGIDGGLKLDFSGLSIVGSGYYGEGQGSTLMFGTPGLRLPVDGVGQERTSYGYIGQLTYTPVGSGWTLGASYGDSRVNQTDNDELINNGELLKSNRAIVGTILYQATQSLKVVFEYTHADAEAHNDDSTKSDQGSAGLMLFF